MKLTLKIWRQPSTDAAGKFETHQVTDAKPEMTLLELLDRLNDALVAQGTEPIAFESDCREGICGTCGITVNGRPHGPVPNTTTCQQHVRSFKDGQTVQPGTLPVGRLPGRAGPDRGPLRTGPRHRGGRLRVGGRRHRARRRHRANPA